MKSTSPSTTHRMMAPQSERGSTTKLPISRNTWGGRGSRLSRTTSTSGMNYPKRSRGAAQNCSKCDNCGAIPDIRQAAHHQRTTNAALTKDLQTCLNGDLSDQRSEGEH